MIIHQNHRARLNGSDVPKLLVYLKSYANGIFRSKFDSPFSLENVNIHEMTVMVRLIARKDLV